MKPQIGADRRGAALPKKWCGRKREAHTGSAGALARTACASTLNLKLLDAVAVSRFALIAGEGARVPSTNRLVLDWIGFLGKPSCPRFLSPKITSRQGLFVLLSAHDEIIALRRNCICNFVALVRSGCERRCAAKSPDAIRAKGPREGISLQSTV